MPAQILDKTIRSYFDAGEVIGVHADSARFNGLNPDAVEHLAVLARPMNLKYNDDADIHHMGESDRPGTVASSKAHITGQVDGVSSLERLDFLIEIRTFETRYGPLQYSVLPHFGPNNDRHSGMPIGVKCSCVGMVVHAIEQVFKLNVLKHGDSNYVKTDLKTLEEIYPASFLKRKHLAGLGDPEPWPVVLPGHLLHALKAGPNGQPFLPNKKHYLFT